MRVIIYLLKRLQKYYPDISLQDILIAALEELLFQNRR